MTDHTDVDTMPALSSRAGEETVLLVRYRPGVVGETARVVHVVPLPAEGAASVTGALCGAVLIPDAMETVSAGEGMPCMACVLHHTMSARPAGEALADLNMRRTGCLIRIGAGQ